MFDISEHPFCCFYPLLKLWGKRLLIFPTTPVMLATNCKDFAIDFSPAIFATMHRNTQAASGTLSCLPPPGVFATVWTACRRNVLHSYFGEKLYSPLRRLVCRARFTLLLPINASDSLG